MNAIAKGLKQFLDEDTSLTEQMTHEDFENKKAAPNNSDKKLEEVYQTYCTVLENLEKEIH